jgi:hypothetical protein
MDNPFLRNFVQMRRQLAQKESAGKKEPARIGALPKPDDDTTLQSIIENTPADKVVREYFKRRVEELSAEDQ